MAQLTYMIPKRTHLIWDPAGTIGPDNRIRRLDSPPRLRQCR